MNQSVSVSTVPKNGESTFSIQAPSSDWDSIRARYNTTKRCVDCLQDKRKMSFTKPQWRACDKTRVCKECVAWHKDKNEPWRCSHCLQWQAAACFPDASRSNNATWTRICSACCAARRCTRCAQLRSKTEFSKKQWARTNRFCLQCAHKGRRQRTPQACLTASCIARARNFIDQSRQRMCLRAIKREIARLRERKEQSSKSAKQKGEVGAQAGADVVAPKKTGKGPTDAHGQKSFTSVRARLSSMWCNRAKSACIGPNPHQTRTTGCPKHSETLE